MESTPFPVVLACGNMDYCSFSKSCFWSFDVVLFIIVLFDLGNDTKLVSLKIQDLVCVLSSPKLLVLAMWRDRCLKTTKVVLTKRQAVYRTRSTIYLREFSLDTAAEHNPVLDTDTFRFRLQSLAPSIASGLVSDGYWTNNASSTGDKVVVTDEEVTAIRTQSMALRKEGRFEQSWSERINDQGESTRFDKEGVFACEPDGRDFHTAPDILLYMSTLISTLPPLLNASVNNIDHKESATTSPEHHVPLNLSNQSFNAKLAVTSPGGSTYPLHVDNTLGIKNSIHDDTRKLTCILYLNPNYQPGDGGELRLLLLNNECLDIAPEGGRVVIFWSDEIPHEVLPCKPDASPDDAHYDRYALTIWFPDTDPRNIQSPTSKFESLRVGAFSGETWC